MLRHHTQNVIINTTTMKINYFKFLAVLFFLFLLFLVYTRHNPNKFSDKILMNTSNVETFKYGLSQYNDIHNLKYSGCRIIDLEKNTIEYNFDNKCGIYFEDSNSSLSGRYKVQIDNKDNLFYASMEKTSATSSIEFDHFTSEYVKNDIKYLEFISNTAIIQDSLNRNYSSLDKLLEKLDYSNISFNSPDELFLNEEHPVILLVSNKLTKDDLFNKLDSILDNSVTDSLEFHKIKSSAILEAQLTGQSFSVTSGSPVRQPISDFDVTKWEWIIQPIVEGDKHLVLTVNAILNINGTETPYTIQTFRKKIKVNVKNKLWFNYKKNEDLYLTIFGIIGALLVAYFSYRLGKRTSNKTEEKTNDNESNPVLPNIEDETNDNNV